ncbi:MAG: hypothetical protein K8S54_04810 [Spirochaetia bacterium]|nr:hypothetical protein [Spirochaetia bacterium]
MSDDSPLKKVLKLFKSDPEFADAVCDRFFQRHEDTEDVDLREENGETDKSENELPNEELALTH